MLKACIYALVKGYPTWDEYENLRKRNRLMHDNFNCKYGYDQILFHEGDIVPEFQKRMEEETPHLRFIDISDEFINTPEINALHQEGKVFDRNMGFKHMCRFNCSSVYHHLKEYDYIMRADDDIFFLSELEYDIIKYIADNNMIMGYGKIQHDRHPATGKTFIPFVNNYVKKNNIKMNPADINMLNYYNNFIILKTSFWFQPEVQKYIDAVLETGNIYRYRWGDSPIQAIGIRMFSKPEQWHYFNDFRYGHGSHNWINKPDSNKKPIARKQIRPPRKLNRRTK